LVFNVYFEYGGFGSKLLGIYRVAQKSKPLPSDQKFYLIILKPVNEIRCIRQNKVWIKYDNIIRWYYFM